MANVRKVDKLETEISNIRSNQAKRTREEKKAQIVDGAIGGASAAVGGIAAASIDHYQGEDGEPHMIGPVPTNMGLGLLAVTAGIFMPKKLRPVGAGLRGAGGGMVGYATGRFWADRLAEKDSD